MRSSASIILPVLLVACGKAEKPTPPPPIVGIVRPVAAEISNWDEVVGRFVSIDAIEVRPRVSGYVVRVGFRDGEDVRRGQLLFEIDPRPYRAALQRAAAQVQRQRATLATARVELKRARDLLAAAATSQQEVQTRLVQAQQAEADLAAAKAERRTAALNLSFTQVRAAVAGRVSDRRVNPGNLVTADQTVLTTIVTLDPIRFAFDMPEAVYLAYTRGGQGGRGAPVQVRLQDESGYPHRGTVEFIDNQVSASAGTVRGRAVIVNADRRLTPGQFGQMRLTGGKPYTAILVPDAAVSQDQDRQLVLVVDRTGAVREKPVTTGPLVGNARVIRSGLDTDQRVIVAGGQKVKPGERVRAKAETFAPPKPGASEPQRGYTTPDASAGIVMGGR